MKHTICFLFLLLLVGFEACKKEEPHDLIEGNGLKDTPPEKAYLKTMVIDNATGLPVSNATFKIETYGFSDTTVVNNWYTGYVGWGGDPRMPWGSRPHDSTDIYIDATLGTLSGRVKIRGWELRENDTLRAPDIYLVP